MLFLIALAIAILTAFLLDKPMKKCPEAFYAAAALLTVISIAVLQSDVTISNKLVKDYVIGIFSRGALGAAFWAVVMWAGALPNGSAPIKKLMPIRGELSITAAILTLSHVVTYGIQYISDILRSRTGSGDARRDFIITSIVCLIMVLIMLPLTVMSFKKVRKKMNGKTWKKIQRSAYVFYALIFVHILVLFIPKAQKGRDGYFLSILVYSAVFIGYAVMRIRKVYISKKKPDAKTAPNIVCACAFILPLCLIGLASRNTNKTETIKATKDNPATFVFETPTGTQDITTTTISAAASSVTTTTVSATVTENVTGTAVTTTTSTNSESATDEPQTNEAEIEEEIIEDEPIENEPVSPAPEEPTAPAAKEPVYRFKNGTFEGSGEGYAGSVHVSITIENDTITSFSAWADDDDPDYFTDAMNKVIPQIAGSLSTDVDACSGATYSSNGIMEAAANALEQAKN
ncbi:MAG TPA: FMN-binding protein [Ruminococcus sp.]|nr:FMN-binding protein [Ruminococcus sp.]